MESPILYTIVTVALFAMAIPPGCRHSARLAVVMTIEALCLLYLINAPGTVFYNRYCMVLFAMLSLLCTAESCRLAIEAKIIDEPEAQIIEVLVV